MAEDTPSEPRCGHSWTYWLLWLCFFVFIIYPLSTGPVVLVIERTGGGEEFIEQFYAPLILLCENFDPASDFFEWYVGDLWGVP